MSSQRCLFEVDKGDNTDGRENTEVLTEAGNVKTEQREVGPQAKECQQPAEARRDVEGSFLRISRKNTALPSP